MKETICPALILTIERLPNSFLGGRHSERERGKIKTKK